MAPLKAFLKLHRFFYRLCIKLWTAAWMARSIFLWNALAGLLGVLAGNGVEVWETAEEGGSGVLRWA